MDLIIVLVNGIAIGGIYGLVALGFVLIYKASRVINFAQGSLVLFGAYAVYALYVQFKFPGIITLILASLIVAALGIGFQHGALRKMIGKPIISIIMITIGLDYLIKGMCLAVWGPTRRIFPVELIPDICMRIGPIFISKLFIWAFLISIFFLACFTIFFKYHKIGVAMRAVSNDQMAALSVGINVNRILIYTWAIAATVAMIGGSLLASLGILDLHLGFIGLVVFPVIIFGGMDSIFGAVLGGFIVGVLESLAGFYLEEIVGGGVRGVAPFFIMLIVLMIMPYGLFGTKEVERL